MSEAQSLFAASAQSPSVPYPIGLDDLPAIDAAQAGQINVDLACLARCVFDIGGAKVRFVGQLPSPPGSLQGSSAAADEPAAWLWLEWAGVPMLAGFSAAWAGAATQALGVGLDQLSDEALDLLAQWQLSPRLPKGLVLRQAALSRSALRGVPEGLGWVRQWSGLHEATAEPCGHSVQLWAAPGLPLHALHQVLAPLAIATVPTALAHLPITLPLVAARWSVDAAVLRDLSIGDVLLLN